MLPQDLPLPTAVVVAHFRFAAFFAAALILLFEEACLIGFLFDLPTYEVVGADGLPMVPLRVQAESGAAFQRFDAVRLAIISPGSA